jgi:hypothetical protein
LYLRKLIITVCALVVLGGATANIAQAKLKICTANMQAKAELKCGKQELHKHVTAARWIKNHASRTISIADPPMSQLWRSRLKFHLWMERRARRWIKQANKRLSYRSSFAGFPPHHLLWLCISSYEGGVHSVNPNGHYGMLQMTYNWLGYIKGKASDYSQSVQEWAAENAYRDNKYSVSFLMGQWFDYDNAEAECLKYA